VFIARDIMFIFGSKAFRKAIDGLTKANKMSSNLIHHTHPSGALVVFCERGDPKMKHSHPAGGVGSGKSVVA
jgi:hypothetical protein